MNSFPYRLEQLHCEHVPLALIAAEIGTPVYVYSRQELMGRARRYLSTAPPGSLICFAVKANGNPTLLRLLAQAGLGADVTSGGELFLAQQAGIPLERIIFSGVGKTAEEIDAALQLGIRALHIESPMELEAVSKAATRLNKIGPIGVRINPNISADTHPSISTGLHTHKFGVPPDQAMQLLVAASRHPQLQPVGLAAHIGSQITDLKPFAESAAFLISFVEELATLGISVSYLDLGGGLGIDYSNEGAPSIESWVDTVARPVQQAGLSFVAEPGRSIIGPAGLLLTKIVYTKDQGQKRFAVTDAGMSHLIRPTLYGARHPIWKVNLEGASDTRLTYDVVGPICETGDYLAKDRSLPALEKDDLLAVMMTGAYGYAMSSNYNGHFRPAEVLVDGNQFHLIRQRQTLQHLLDGCLPLQ
jgi:diaminopimelate decarboxylase